MESVSVVMERFYLIYYNIQAVHPDTHTFNLFLTIRHITNLIIKNF